MKFKIETNIPAPPERGEISRVIAKLKKGDSVLLPNYHDARRFQVQMNRQFGLRSRSQRFPDGTVRVWHMGKIYWREEK